MVISTTEPRSRLCPLRRPAPERAATVGRNLVECFQGNAMVAVPSPDPVLEGWIADADLFGGLPWCEQIGRIHPVLYTVEQGTR